MDQRTKSKRLTSYVYVAERLVNSYFDQIRPLEEPEKINSLNISLSLTGPKVDLSQTKKLGDPSMHEKILKIEKFLEEKGDLDHKRPQESIDNGCIESTRFVSEVFTARKVIVPCKDSGLGSDVDFFVVWISDPDPAVHVVEDYVWRGTFLYLVEGWHDSVKYHSTYSGCSALQFIMNIADGKKPLELGDGEPLGRGSDLHPIDKLRRLGATTSDQRRLFSLYRKRYVTNEQCYDYSGQKRRVNDLVGYPLFIANAD
jgi:hypothetical protein